MGAEQVRVIGCCPGCGGPALGFPAAVHDGAAVLDCGPAGLGPVPCDDTRDGTVGAVLGCRGCGDFWFDACDPHALDELDRAVERRTGATVRLVTLAR